jgi:hypothetical protein
LIYANFATQYDLLNAVLRRDFDRIWGAGLIEAADGQDFVASAIAIGGVYFEHILRHGPVSHLILREPFMAGRLAPDLRSRRDLFFLILARRAKLFFHLPVRETIASIYLLMTIPEVTARVVRQGNLAADEGRALSARLLRSGLTGLRPVERGSG